MGEPDERPTIAEGAAPPAASAERAALPPAAAAGAGAAGRPPTDAWATFDRWSSNLFLVLAVLGLVVTLTVAGASATYAARGALLAAVAIAGCSLVILVVTAAGLDRRLAWARPTAWVILLVMIVSGLAGAALDLARNTLTVPLGSAFALLVASRRPGPIRLPGGRDRGIAIGLSVAYVVAGGAAGAPAWLLTSPASPLVADATALELRLEVGCPAGAPGSRIPVAVSWTWREREPFAGGTDGVGVAWAYAGETGEAGDGVAFDADSVTRTDLAWMGGASPSDGAVQDVVGGAPNLTWGIDVERGRLADAGVAVDLVGPGANGSFEAHGALTVWAVYAHLDRWTVRRETTCSW
ncbi:MAG: hypothetical protein AB1627_03995 [Chloroflexota bacterium]